MSNDIAAALFVPLDRVSIEAVTPYIEEDQDLDSVSFRLETAASAGDPTPTQLKSTFIAQV